jgi:hypothetical protein
MKHNHFFQFTIGLFFFAAALSAQQFNSVPLSAQVYDIIDNAVLRGLVKPPASSRPWSEHTVKQSLTAILDAGQEILSPVEKKIISDLIDSFDRKTGIDWSRGTYNSRQTLKNGAEFSFGGGINWESVFSVNFKDPVDFGTSNRLGLFLYGDMGSHLSWAFEIGPGFYWVEREVHPAYTDPVTNVTTPQSYEITSFFPYTFSGIWDGTVTSTEDFSFEGWPDFFSFGYEVISEINASWFDDRMVFRFGRMRRDWGLGEKGASLFLNSLARPFLAVEGSFLPVDWLRLSSLTGVLEYWPRNGQMKDDAYKYQNAFSASLLELNVSKYFRFDFGASVVWPKRFELGYLYPANSNLIYQNNVGDFDNIGLYGDLEGSLPGIGKIWFSLFIDEIRIPSSPFFNLDRNMYAYQAGLKGNIPWLPFASLSIRYTKIEPYCYTHRYTIVPWFNEIDTFENNKVENGMATNYVNTGEGLGYYLHPNSDEMMVRLESHPRSDASIHMQYQMIRHGVEYGPNAVDGSGLEDQQIYDNNTLKYFLEDGVYQWSHVLKIGGSYSLKSVNIPLSLFAETGIVITRYTINGSAGKDRGDYEALDNDIYRAGTGFIFSLGFKLYP